MVCILVSVYSALDLNLHFPIAEADPKDADIIWTSMQVDEDMKAAAGLTDQQYVNQFPFEACLVMKHHLAETVQKVLTTNLFCMTAVTWQEQKTEW